MGKQLWVNGTVETSHLRIQVMNNHIHHKGVWVMHVREFDWNCKYLNIPNDSTQEQAQKAAIKAIRHFLQTVTYSLKGL